MKSRRWLNSLLALLCFLGLAVAQANAQSPSALYTWNGTGNVQAWVQNFAAAGGSSTLANTIGGELTLTETSSTAGASVAWSDGANRVRETPSAPSGGTDVTGLDYLEFVVGHNGASPINVQFFVQASTGFNFVALGPDVAVAPGINTYQVPITALTAPQAVYLRTIGMNVRDHAALGNVTWTVQEVRAGGTPLESRNLATFDNGTAEGGLQGAIVNFNNAGVAGNNGGQNQTGLSHSSAGSGSLQWTSPAGGTGGAITLGNGTAWNGNTFNNRTTDLSNYNTMLVRISATETTPGAGGTVSLTPFFQVNNFATFQGLVGQALPIDGQFHDLVFPYTGTLVNMNVIDQIGLSLGTHASELTFNVDLIQFNTPEPASLTLFGIALMGGLGFVGRSRRGK